MKLAERSKSAMVVVATLRSGWHGSRQEVGQGVGWILTHAVAIVLQNGNLEKSPSITCQSRFKVKSILELACFGQSDSTLP